ncbi:class I SAM-dependent methyltransferase [Streptomyces sp. NPDC006422]|uniref:class I SAM-dependent methyltransferase n=1 Tax=unclassified Streptomyces TaxID=2593676 RepID=UPI0033AECF27
MAVTAPATATRSVAERRPAYLTELAQGTERFHEPRRPDCPWCGSSRLRTRLRTTDLLQHKPGSFVLDRCDACGHTFQNPGLTPQGQEFYGRDHHDGRYADHAERIFGARAAVRRYRSCVRAVAAHIEPESWLDVGTGRGRFAEVAKELLPYTAFDGLDSDEGLQEARRADRVERAHHGLLTELAPRLEGGYDALSMLHHLEHTRDPREELKAARRVLRPGGHLVIEASDPDSRFARLLGKWWIAYFQPRRRHLVPLANLRTELRALGYTVVAVDRRAAHVPLDLAAGLALFVGDHLPDADAPWRTKAPSDAQRTLRTLLTHAVAPALLAARTADRLLAPLARRTRFRNAYRVIARRDPDA